QYRIEVDDTVKRAAGSNPVVDGLPSSFLRFRIVARNVHAFTRGHRGTNQLDSTGVGARNQLAVRADKILGAPRIPRISQRESSQLSARKSEVIDPFQQHDMSDSRH